MDERGECEEPHARARLAWAGQRTRAHDMRVNGPSKSDPRVAWARLPFAILFFGCLAVKFRILIDRYMDPNRTQDFRVQIGSWIVIDSRTTLYKAPSSQRQNHHNFRLCSQLCRHHSYLHPDRQRSSTLGRADLQNLSPSRSCTGRGRIRFLENVLMRLLAILSSNPTASTSSAMLL
jgi:hypothetical protein